MNHSRKEMYPAANAARRRMKWLSFVVILCLCSALPALAASGGFVAHNTPPYVKTAKNLGTENPSKTIEVSIWLSPHNRADLDAKQLYERTSPNYPHFLNRAQIAARFAPTAEEAKTVRQFFEAHNLKVVKSGPDNFFVRACGTVGNVENAFHVVLNNYQVRDKIIRANDRDPYVTEVGHALLRRSADALIDTSGSTLQRVSPSELLSLGRQP